MCKKTLTLVTLFALGSVNQVAIAEDLNCDQYQAAEEEIKNLSSVENLAIVIGNGNYKEDGKTSDFDNLNLAKNDASKMKDKFSKNNFHVLYKEDATKSEMDSLICKMGYFLKYHPSINTVAFYFSGHGTSDPFTKDNLLVPTDMNFFTIYANSFNCNGEEKGNEICKELFKERDCDQESCKVDGYEGKVLNLNTVLQKMKDYYPKDSNGKLLTESKRNHLVLLDACRSNGISEDAKTKAIQVAEQAVKGLKKGPIEILPKLAATKSTLGAMSAVSSATDLPNSLIGFAAGIGKSALEFKNAENSVYTKHLLEHIFNKSVTLKQALDQVIINVKRETRKEKEPQVPRYDASLEEEIYLGGQQELNYGFGG